jgi:hypothetical protein
MRRMQRLKSMAFAVLVVCWALCGTPSAWAFDSADACYSDCSTGQGCCLVSTQWNCTTYCNDMCQYQNTNPQSGPSCQVDLGSAGWANGQICWCQDN